MLFQLSFLIMPRIKYHHNQAIIFPAIYPLREKAFWDGVCFLLLYGIFLGRLAIPPGPAIADILLIRHYVLYPTTVNAHLKLHTEDIQPLYFSVRAFVLRKSKKIRHIDDSLKGTAPMDRGDIPRSGVASMKPLSHLKRQRLYRL